MARATLGVIIGNRDFFPDALVTEARADVLALFEEMDLEPVILDVAATKLGGVETWREAQLCAELFDAHRKNIEGVLVVLPNFGDEKGIADTMRLSGLDVPILLQAYPDDVTAFNLERRRDAFCGKISACSDLRQYGFAYSLTERHTIPVQSDAFRADLDSFVRTCKVANGMRRARLGAIGTRPDAFKTVRYSEKLLEAVRHRRQRRRLQRDLRPRRQARRRRGPGDVPSSTRSRAYLAHPTVPPDQLVTHGPPRRGHRRLDGEPTTSTPRPSSAGTRCRRTTASTSARS